MSAPTNTCEDCHFFEPSKEDETVGTCHALPPRGAPSIDEKGYWPIVDIDDWCGMYKHDGSST
jgi:hypothetical protein